MESNYINLLKKTLIDYTNIGRVEYYPLDIVKPNWKTFFLYPIHRVLKSRNFGIAKIKTVDKTERLNGYDWPAQALTMIGLNRLDNLEFCARDVLENSVPGDFVETGVWRGGASILMRALLKEYKVSDRFVWLADSFEGVPKPNELEFPEDAGNSLYKFPILSCSLDEVKENFASYDLLDNQVKFLQGWFSETLPNNEIENISVLRLDGDLYESTHYALEHLYPKLSVGGYLIVDDYNAFPFCKKAVDDYRDKFQVSEQIIEIDKEAIYWRKIKS